MKILITGGAGFIGSHLCDRLLERGDDVVVIDNFSSGRRENLPEADHRLTILEDDLLNIGRYRDELADVDRVFHLAALISGHDSLHEAEEYIEANLIGLSRLIDLVSNTGIERIILASSSTVYGQQPTPLIGEGCDPDPLTVYALTKLSGEHLLSLYSQLHGFSHVSLRLFNVYGPRQAEDHPYANVTCKFSYAAAHGHGVKRYGDGEQTRDFVYIDDVVDAFLAVEQDSEHSFYNVGTGEDASINRLLKLLGEIRGEPLEFEQYDAWPNDIREIRADVTRLKEEFGFQPSTKLKDGLERTVQFFKEQGKPE